MITAMWGANSELPESRMAALAISFALGILAAAYCESIIWLSLGAIAGLAVYFAWPAGARSAAYILLAVYALGGAWFAVRMQTPGDDISRVPERVSVYEGTLASDPEFGDGKVKLLIDANRALTAAGWRDVSGFVMTTVYLSDEAECKLSYGDRVKVSARPYVPFPPTNPGQFSYKDYLQRQGIRSCATVRDSANIVKLTGNSGNPIVGAALVAKHYLASAIQRIHPKQEASVVIGMVLGTYAYLPKETFDNFSRTGTLHLLAASGFNCFILALMAAWVLRKLRLTPKWISIVSVALLIFYLMMVGAKPSLVRATVMAGLWLLAVPLKRVPNLRSLFFTAALVTLAMSPGDLFDVGFQLSFAAVWALITSGAIVEQLLSYRKLAEKPNRRKPRHPALVWVRKELTSAATATVTVSLFTTPIVAYHFNYISLVSLPANIALALGVYVLFAVGLLASAGALVPMVGGVIGWIGTRVTDAMLAVVNYLGSGPYSAITVPTPGLLAMVGYYVLLYVGLDYLRSKLAEG